GDDLAALDVLALQTTQEEADVVAGLALVEELAEHLHAGDDRLLGLADADDLDLLADLDDAALDAPGGHGAAALDGEDVLDRHQERLVLGGNRGGGGAVDGVHHLREGVEAR